MALNAAELQITITADSSQAEQAIGNVEGMISGVLVGHQVKNFGEDALGFVGDFISVGATFEEQMTLIDRIIGGTMSHMDELKQKAIDADVRTMFDAMEVTKGMEMLARAGFDATQIIGQPGQNNGLIDAVLNFAGATAESTEVAGRSFAAVARIFQNSGVSMVDIADLMTAAVLRSGKSASEFMTAFQYVGSISQQFGTTPDDIVTVIALMEQLGVRSMSVGTSLRSFYSGIASNRAGIEAMGVSLYTLDDAGNEVLRTLPDIIQQFHKLSTTMKPDEFYAMLEDTFGKPAASGLMTLFTTGAEHMDDFKASMDGVNDAQSIMDARMNTLRGSLEKFSATWLGLKKVLGDSVAQYIKPIVDGATWLVNVIQNAPKPVHQLIAAVIALSGALAFLTGSLIIFNAVGGVAALTGALGILGSTALPIIAILGALGIAALAIKTDFGGVTTWVKGLSDKLDEFKRRYHQGQVYGTSQGIVKGHARQDQIEIERMYTGNYMKIANALAAIRDMGGPNLLPLWKKLFPHVKEVAEGVERIGRGFGRMSDIIKKNGLVAGIKDLFGGRSGKLIMAGMGDILSEAPRMLGTFLRNFDTGSERINRILRNIGQGFKLFGNAIENAFDGKGAAAWDSFLAGLQRMFAGGVQIRSLVLDVLKWGFTTAVDVAAQLTKWVLGKVFGTNSHVVAGPGGDFAGATVAPGTDGIPIGSITLSIIGWLITSAVSLVVAVVGKLIEWWPAVQSAVKDGWHLAVGISTWLVKEVSDGSLYTTAWNYVKDQLATRDITIDGMVINIKTDNLDITIDLPSLWSIVKTKFDELSTFTPDEQAQAQGLGESLGKNAIHYLFVGLKKIITVDNIKKLLGLNDKSKGDKGDQNLSMALAKFVVGFFKGAGQQLEKEVNDIIEQEIKMPIYRVYDRFVLWLKGGLVANTPGSTGVYQSGVWDKIKEALTPDLDFDAPELPAWMSTDLDWLLGPVQTLIDKIDDAVSRLQSAWERLHFWRNPKDKNDGPGPVNANPQADLLLGRDLNGSPGVRDANGNAIPAGAPPPDPNRKPDSTQTFMNFGGAIGNVGRLVTQALDPVPGLVNAKLTDVKQKFSAFASFGSRQALAPLGGVLDNIATTAMGRFNAGLGTGFAGSIRLAFASAQAIAIAATPPNMWNTGFNTGYDLGAGVAAGIIASLGLVSSARTQLDLTAGGQNQKSAPFGGGTTTSSSVEPKQPTVVNQTNHITMSVSEVEEMVGAAKFVSSLDRQRQITLGRA